MKRKSYSPEDRKAYMAGVSMEIETVLRDWFDNPADLADKAEKLLRPGSDMPSDNWSLGNQLIMLAMGTEYAAGFRQWEGCGRRVRKGARSFHILAPRMVKREDRDKPGEKYSVLVGFKTVPVFRLEDTQGPADWTAPGHKEPENPPPLLDVAAKFGLTVKYRGGENSREYGWFIPGKAEICLKTDNWQTFFHELSHAAHDRLEKSAGRKGIKTGQHPDQECVAELSAVILARRYGVECPKSTYNYVKAYSGNPVKALYHVLSTVKKVIAEILAHAKTVPEAV